MNIKKYFLFVLVPAIGISCSNNQSNFGYVYDGITQKPIEKVKVESLPDKTITFTDSAGYFDLKKTAKISSSLIFNKKGYVIDTIETVSVQHESMRNVFTGDTSFMLPIINGIIHDNKTKHTLSNVQVYDLLGNNISNSDANGYFELATFKYQKMIFKKENYLSDTITIYNIAETQKQVIELTQKVSEKQYFLISINKKNN